MPKRAKKQKKVWLYHSANLSHSENSVTHATFTATQNRNDFTETLKALFFAASFREIGLKRIGMKNIRKLVIGYYVPNTKFERLARCLEEGGSLECLSLRT